MTLSKFTAGESRERTTLRGGGGGEISLKRDVESRVIPRFSEGGDSLLTIRAGCENAAAKPELLFPGE